MEASGGRLPEPPWAAHLVLGKGRRLCGLGIPALVTVEWTVWPADIDALPNHGASRRGARTGVISAGQHGRGIGLGV